MSMSLSLALPHSLSLASSLPHFSAGFFCEVDAFVLYDYYGLETCETEFAIPNPVLARVSTSMICTNISMP